MTGKMSGTHFAGIEAGTETRDLTSLHGRMVRKTRMQADEVTQLESRLVTLSDRAFAQRKVGAAGAEEIMGTLARECIFLQTMNPAEIKTVRRYVVAKVNAVFEGLRADMEDEIELFGAPL